MSYRDTQQPSWIGANNLGSTVRVRVAGTEPRADYITRRPVRCSEHACDGQPSLLTVIAHELSQINGGATAEHLSGAKRLLEAAFRAVEQAEDTPGNGSGRVSREIRGETCELKPPYAQCTGLNQEYSQTLR